MVTPKKKKITLDPKRETIKETKHKRTKRKQQKHKSIKFLHGKDTINKIQSKTVVLKSSHYKKKIFSMFGDRC